MKATTSIPLFRIASLTLLAILLLALAPASVAGNVGAGGAPQANPTAGAAMTSDDSASQSNAIRGSIGTTLVKALDSKRLREGDIVVCQTAGTIRSNGVLISAGTKITGHVTRATARAKGDSDSSLGVVFDKIEISKGKEVPMKGTLQAVGPSLGSNEPDRPNGMWESPTASNAPPIKTVGMSSNDVREPARPMLNSESAGVKGVRDLTMDKDSTLSSSGKEVKACGRNTDSDPS